MMPLWLLFVIILSRLFLGGLGFIDAGRFIRPDSIGYIQLANNLWRHGVFSQSDTAPYFPEAFRTPGYPFFIGFWTTALHLSLAWVIAVQCLLSIGVLLWLWNWLSRISTPKRATLATLALALDPVVYFHTPLILGETLFLTVITAAMILTWEGFQDEKTYKWAGRGFLWSLAALVRPVSLYLPLLISAACIRSKKVLVAFLVAAYLLPFLWCARNLHQTGYFSFTTQGGIDLMKYPASAIVAIQTNRPLQEAQDSLKGPIDAAHAPYASPFEQSRLYGQRAAQVILQHPLVFMRFCMYGAARTLFGSAFEMFFETTGIPSDVPYPGYQPKVAGHGTLSLLRMHQWLVPFYALYILGLLTLYIVFLCGILKLWAMRRFREERFLLISALYLLCLSSPLGHYRFRIPMMPFVLAGASFAFLSSKRRSLEN